MKDNIARRKRVDIMYTYYNNCVNWPASDVYASGGLSDMVQYGTTITRRTFQHNVGASILAEFELNMGYPCGQLTMKDDYAVSYHRGKLHSQRVYWVNHSSIEYVFVSEDYLNKK
jgi:hypothetical protein